MSVYVHILFVLESIKNHFQILSLHYIVITHHCMLKYSIKHLNLD